MSSEYQRSGPDGQDFTGPPCGADYGCQLNAGHDGPHWKPGMAWITVRPAMSVDMAEKLVAHGQRVDAERCPDSAHTRMIAEAQQALAETNQRFGVCTG